MAEFYKVACVQMDCIPCDIEENLEKAGTYLIEAKKQGAKLVVLPELFNIGYNLEEFKKLNNYSALKTIEFLSKMSKELGIYIVAGLAESLQDGLYNSAYVFDNLGEVICKYNKMNLFPLSDERKIFIEGNKIATFSFGDFKAGILICYDIRFPEVTIKYFEENCNVLIVLSAFPFPRLDHWRTLLRARAIEGQSYIIASNRVGNDGELCFLGNSRIIDPWGTDKAILNESEEGIIIHQIEYKNIAEVRSKMRCFENKSKLIDYLRSTN
ncbi:UNVERIFIED_CONTAM: putative amidohydrolase [Acetivibrio alkalicellulosi]